MSFPAFECLNCCASRTQPTNRGASDAFDKDVASRPAYNVKPGTTRVGGGNEGISMRLICFDETDNEIRQLVIKRSMPWKDMRDLITDVLGQPAMLAYDNGVGVDIKVETDADWEQFLWMLERETVLNREYDILLLPAGSWKRYQASQTKH